MSIIQLLTIISLCTSCLCMKDNVGINDHFEAGLKRISLPTQVTLYTHSMNSAPLIVTFQRNYLTPPVAALVLSNFESQSRSQERDELSNKISMKIETGQIAQNYVKATIFYSSNVRLIVVSYFAMDKKWAQTFGCFVFNFQNVGQMSKSSSSDQPQTQIKTTLRLRNAQTGTSKIFSTFSIYIQKLQNSHRIQAKSFLNELKIQNTFPADFSSRLVTQMHTILEISYYDATQKDFPQFCLIIYHEQGFEKLQYLSFETTLIQHSPIYFQPLQRNQNNLLIGLQSIHIQNKCNQSSVHCEPLFGLVIFTYTDDPELDIYVSRQLLSCSTPMTYPTIYQNYWVGGVDPVKKSTETCQSCPTGCFTCVYCSDCFRYVNCTSCLSGFTYGKLGIINDKQYVCRCTSPLVPNATTDSCMACSAVVAHCVSCISMTTGHYSATCDTCETGYYPVANNSGSWGGFNYCYLCQSGCSTCNSSSVCTKCGAGLTMTSNVCSCPTNNYYSASALACVPCPILFPNCLTCVAVTTTTTCTLCSSGFYTNGTACLVCSSNCNNCTATNCTSCKPTFISSGINCVCDASNQMFVNTSGSCATCSNLIVGCLSCTFNTTVICSTCAVGYFVSNSSCTTCSSTCINCTSLNTCQSCQPTFVIINSTCACNSTDGFYYNSNTKTCISCSAMIPSCSVCIDNNSTSPTCNSCNLGYYIASNTSCLQCDLSCQNCTSATVCVQCIAGYSLNGSSLCECTNCSACNATGLSNCVSCSNDTNGTFCTLCLPGYFLNGTICSQCPIGCANCLSTSNCPACLTPFILVNSTQCSCDFNSLQYYDPNTQNCSSCLTVQPNCTSCISINYTTSCLVCSYGYYVLNGTCFACSYPCSTCTATACLTCNSTYQLINGSCVCDNSAGLFLNTNTSLCASCASITTSICLTCQNQPLAVSTFGVQCSSCPAGYFADTATYLCTICPTTCSNCLNLTYCTICQSTFSLINNLCVCDTSNGIFPLYDNVCAPCEGLINYCTACNNSNARASCSHCIVGTYLSADNSTCLLCPVNCLTCNSTNCVTCQPGYNVAATGECQCVTTCLSFTGVPTGCLDCTMQVNVTANTSTLLCLACTASTFNAANTTCNLCPPTCATCSDYITCLTCLPSYSLIADSCKCNSYKNQLLISSLCYNCDFLITGCQKCTSATVCTSCKTGWVLSGSICVLCGSGCLTCDITTTICYKCLSFYTLSLGTCGIQTCNSALGVYFNTNNGMCDNCGFKCLTCIDIDTCINCDTTIAFINLVDGACTCNNGLGYFFNYLSGQCEQCTSQVGLAACQICYFTMAYSSTGISCNQCQSGFFVSGGICSSCGNGCNSCTGVASCCSCNQPSWIMSNGTCICNEDQSYFSDNLGHCLACNLTYCSLCQNLSVCLVCNYGYFVDSTTNGTCKLAVCQNGVVEGIEACDDGNNITGDGCSPTCTVEPYYFCTGSPSTCAPDSRFNLKLTQINVKCNKIAYSFQIQPYYPSYDAGYYSYFLVQQTISSQMFLTLQKVGDTLTYTYSLTQSIQNTSITFVFDPQYLSLAETSSYPRITLTFQILPTNNMLALYYDSSICTSYNSIQQLTTVIQYTSYSILILSALPAKIVGLELFGVIQLAFFSVASMDNINIMMQPLAGLKGVNGLNWDLGAQPTQKRLLQSSTLTPDSIDAIGYGANFIRNCNIMLGVVIVVIIVALFLYSLTFLCANCSPKFHSISTRLLKEVLLTLILFNCLNFAYSAGLHFRYASREDSLFVLGTIAAIATLIILVLMAIGLMLAEQKGFGEFKDKLKSGNLQKAYFVITIIYRMSLGLYMSTDSQNELSTLIVLALSILFLLYNLVNLPFTKAYHNYRANICHLTQFICLFVAMYYRSMKSSGQSESSSTIFSPVYLQFACILISLVVSLIVLCYQIYIFVKECCINSQVEKRQDSDVQHNKIVNYSIQSMHEGKNQEIKINIQEYDLYN